VRASLVALCLLTGCRQVLGLDPSVLNDAGEAKADSAKPDADPSCGIGDFDGDGVSDNCDLCPHLPSNSINTDLDADGVGNECDPNLVGGDQRALWLGFDSPNDIVGWTGPMNTWTVSNHRLHAQTNAQVTLESPVAFSSDIYFATSLIISQPGTNQVGFCVARDYCCTAANSSSGKAEVYALSSAGSPIVALATFGSGFVTGEQLNIEATLSDTKLDCKFTRANSVNVGAAATAGTKTGPVGFYATAPVDYRYVFVVTTRP
jgi:hypothetical protein